MQRLDRSNMLIQICESMANEQTKKREILALPEAMDELNLNFGTIVTRDEEDEIQIDNKKINVIPIWRYLLEAK